MNTPTPPMIPPQPDSIGQQIKPPTIIEIVMIPNTLSFLSTV